MNSEKVDHTSKLWFGSKHSKITRHFMLILVQW